MIKYNITYICLCLAKQVFIVFFYKLKKKTKNMLCLSDYVSKKRLK